MMQLMYKLLLFILGIIYIIIDIDLIMFLNVEPVFENSFTSLQSLHSPKFKKILIRKPEIKSNKKFICSRKNHTGSSQKLSFVTENNIDQTNDTSSEFSEKMMNCNSIAQFEVYNKEQREKQLEQKNQKCKKSKKVISFISPGDTILNNYKILKFTKQPEKQNNSVNRQRSNQIDQNPQVNINQLKKVNTELRTEISFLKEQIDYYQLQLTQKENQIKNKQLQQNHKSQQNELIKITLLYQRLTEQIKSSTQKTLKLESKIIDLNHNIFELKMKLDHANQQLMVYKQQLEIQRQSKITDQTYIYQLHQNIDYMKLRLQTAQRKIHFQQVDQQAIYRLQLRNENLIKLNQQLKKKMHRIIFSGKMGQNHDMYELSPDK